VTQENFSTIIGGTLTTTIRTLNIPRQLYVKLTQARHHQEQRHLSFHPCLLQQLFHGLMDCSRTRSSKAAVHDALVSASGDKSQTVVDDRG
jgi:hypothetical protein